MVFDANIDAMGNCTDQSIHHTEVSLVSLHNKLIFGTLGIVAVILGIAIAVWIFHRKRITKHKRRHAALLALTYSPEEQTLRHAEGGEARHKHPQRLNHGQGSRLGYPPTP
jgi:flagellar biosynthesis/type III secretory pathway M-ring protein FliF/YscJ